MASNWFNSSLFVIGKCVLLHLDLLKIMKQTSRKIFFFYWNLSLTRGRPAPCCRRWGNRKWRLVVCWNTTPTYHPSCLEKDAWSVHRLLSSVVAHGNNIMAAKQNHLFATFIILVQIGQIKLDTRISDVVFNPPKESIMKDPTILLAIIARNAQHLLPNWLGYIENLDYPKDRMSVW